MEILIKITDQCYDTYTCNHDKDEVCNSCPVRFECYTVGNNEAIIIDNRGVVPPWILSIADELPHDVMAAYSITNWYSLKPVWNYVWRGRKRPM